MKLDEEIIGDYTEQELSFMSDFEKVSNRDNSIIFQEYP